MRRTKPRRVTVRHAMVALATAAFLAASIGGVHLYVEWTQEWYFTVTPHGEQIGPFKNSHDCENARLVAGTSRSGPCRRTR